MKKKSISIVSALLVSLSANGGLLSSAPAQPLPERISYQGQLTINGMPFPGPFANFKFVIFDGAFGTLWSNDGTSTSGSQPSGYIVLPVQNGTYSVLLGGYPLFPPQHYVTSSKVYNGTETSILRVWVDTGSGFQQVTDQPMASVPWALVAQNAKGSLGSFVSKGRISSQLSTGGVISSLSGIGNFAVTLSCGNAGDSYVSNKGNFGANGAPAGGVLHLGGSQGVKLMYGEVAPAGTTGLSLSPSGRISLIGPGATEIAGAALSPTFVTSSGTLGNSVGAELALANFGFLSGNNTSLAIKAVRRDAIPPGQDGWPFTSVGLVMDVDNSADQGASVWLSANGNVGIGNRNPQTTLDVAGTTKTSVLEITGGSDLSERFAIGEAELAGTGLEPGMVVCIDPESPGGLVVSSTTYDRRVAGILSGAGGVKPGMLMSQPGSEADGTHPVALTGRVYCWVDAGYGAITPGDLLTTSDTAGHAMKVDDYAKAQGAILGKAMSPLKQGRGLVLVLVSLQ